MVDPERGIAGRGEEITTGVTAAVVDQYDVSSAGAVNLPNGVVNTAVGANFRGIRHTLGEESVLLDVGL